MSRPPVESSNLGPGARLLYLGPFVSLFDRFSIAPLLIPIAADFHVSLGVAATAATLYYLFIGLTQPVYGLLSDRYGRVAVMRASLAVVLVASLASAAAPNVWWLIGARVVAGATVGAVIPASLVYVGDTLPFRLRQRAITEISAATALGTALGIVTAGVMAGYVSWRATFLITGAIAGSLAVAFRMLPEPARARRPGGPMALFVRVLGNRWAVLLMGLALVEGAAFYGLTTFFAPALQAAGAGSAVAGFVAAGYGLATLVGSRFVKHLTLRMSASSLIIAGGAPLIAGYALAAAESGMLSVLLASLLVGVAFAFLHTTLQTWITEVVPEARGTATALFATGLFLGAAISTAVAGGAAQHHAYSGIFVAGAGLGLVVTTVAAVARRSYQGSAAASEVALETIAADSATPRR